MIQPAMISYNLNSETPIQVHCDLSELKPEVVLLVDTYFYVLIWKGINI